LEVTVGKKKSEWNKEFMKRLDREDPERNKKADRIRGFTPPMPFCECGSVARSGNVYHSSWCPVVGGQGAEK
jgi:hypothetical protein